MVNSPYNENQLIIYLIFTPSFFYDHKRRIFTKTSRSHSSIMAVNSEQHQAFKNHAKVSQNDHMWHVSYIPRVLGFMNYDMNCDVLFKENPELVGLRVNCPFKL